MRFRDALDYLIPFALAEQTWKHEQITPLDGSKLAECLRRAAVAYDHPPYESTLNRVIPPDQLGSAPFQLTHPSDHDQPQP